MRQPADRMETNVFMKLRDMRNT